MRSRRRRVSPAPICCATARPSPASLVGRQAATWQPWLDWAERQFDARLAVADGVMPVTQPEAALRALRVPVERLDDWRLVGLHGATTLLGSLVLGLARRARRARAPRTRSPRPCWTSCSRSSSGARTPSRPGAMRACAPISPRSSATWRSSPAERSAARCAVQACGHAGADHGRDQVHGRRSARRPPRPTPSPQRTRVPPARRRVDRGSRPAQSRRRAAPGPGEAIRKTASRRKAWPRVARQDCARPNARSSTLAAGQDQVQAGEQQQCEQAPDAEQGDPANADAEGRLAGLVAGDGAGRERDQAGGRDAAAGRSGREQGSTGRNATPAGSAAPCRAAARRARRGAASGRRRRAPPATGSPARCRRRPGWRQVA